MSCPIKMYRLYHATMHAILVLLIVSCSEEPIPPENTNTREEAETKNFTLLERHLVNKKLTFGDTEVNRLYEVDYIFMKDGNVDVVIRNHDGAAPTTRLKWEIEGNSVFINNGSRVIGYNNEAPRELQFEESPKSNSTVTFISNDDGLPTTEHLLFYGDVESREKLNLAISDFVNRSFTIEQQKNPRGEYKAKYAFNDDQTGVRSIGNIPASYTTSKFTWELINPYTLRMNFPDTYNNSNAYTEVEFRTSPSLGDEVFLKSENFAGETPRLDSSFIVELEGWAESNTPAHNTNGFLTKEHFLHTKLTFQGGSTDNLYEIDYTFRDNFRVYVKTRDTRGSSQTTRLTWEIDGNSVFIHDGSRVIGYNHKAPRELQFSEIPHTNMNVTFIYGGNGVPVSSKLIGYEGLTPLEDINFTDADFIGKTIVLDVNKNPNGTYKVSYTYRGDNTGTRTIGNIPGGVHDMEFSWYIVGSDTVHMDFPDTYNNPDAYTENQYTKALEIGDEVFTKQVNFLGEAPREGSTYIVEITTN